MKNNSTLARQSLLAALYVAMTLSLPGLSYGAVQFRISEVLMLLAFYNKENSIGLIMGCFLANMFSELAVYDMIFGTLATAIVCFLFTRTKQKVLLPVFGAFVNALIIGIGLKLVLFLPFTISFISIFLSEFIILVIAIVLFHFLEKKGWIQKTMGSNR